jgi:hypothetical protein
MAAPTPTARQTPAGIRLDDGFSAKITFAADPDVSLWEVEVTPFGADGGDAIDTSTQHNTVWRTKSARALKEMTDGSFSAAYDPAVITQLVALINVETTVTYTFPDGSTWAVYGYLRSFTPGALVEGAMPMADCVLTPTNYDPVNKVEAGPALASVPGT